MREEPIWLSLAVALAIHDRLLAEYGGPPGVRDLGLLESALAASPNRFGYEKADLYLLAATYAYAITRDHPFNDGNKRVALTLAAVFLERNGIVFDADEADAVVQVVALSARGLSMEDFAAWLKANSRSSSRFGFRIQRRKRKSS